MRLPLIALGVALLSISTVAKADVLYTITTNDQIPAGVYGQSSFIGTYTFIEPSILTSGFTITPSQLTSDTANFTLLSLWINPTGAISGYGCSDSSGYACLTVFSTGSYIDNYFFDGQTLTSDGEVTYSYSYSLGDDDYNLNATVTITPYAAATPEPSSLALLGTSLLGLGGILRRRLA